MSRLVSVFNSKVGRKYEFSAKISHVLHTHAFVSRATALKVPESESGHRADYSSDFRFYVLCLKIHPKCC